VVWDTPGDKPQRKHWKSDILCNNDFSLREGPARAGSVSIYGKTYCRSRHGGLVSRYAISVIVHVHLWIETSVVREFLRKEAN